MLLGAIEAGGTKFVCAIGNEEGLIEKRKQFDTTTPEETMKKVISFFKDKNIKALGVGSFGPIDLNEKSDTFGYITSTPKAGWKNYNILGELKKHFNIPIGFDTDVNGAALGEMNFGAARGLKSCVYMTVGTGIGAGAVVEGKLLHGMLHPEMGHIILNRHKDDNFEGICPYHKSCFEGMASGPSIEKRWGKKGTELGENHKAWDIEAYYIAEALVNFVLILSPEKIILGGGVMKQKQLFPKIRSYLKDMLNQYVVHKNLQEDIEDYIVYPYLGDNAGICGALALAKNIL